jgi:hypothetical protein
MNALCELSRLARASLANDNDDRVFSDHLEQVLPLPKDREVPGMGEREG